LKAKEAAQEIEEEEVLTPAVSYLICFILFVFLFIPF
jgi:hypothetical protein